MPFKMFEICIRIRRTLTLHMWSPSMYLQRCILTTFNDRSSPCYVKRRAFPFTNARTHTLHLYVLNIKETLTSSLKR